MEKKTFSAFAKQGEKTNLKIEQIFLCETIQDNYTQKIESTRHI